MGRRQCSFFCATLVEDENIGNIFRLQYTTNAHMIPQSTLMFVCTVLEVLHSIRSATSHVCECTRRRELLTTSTAASASPLHAHHAVTSMKKHCGITTTLPNASTY
eukprot:m.49418 g.49418  ORF g.49418 m.49418 type:complete len:106 (-) comp15325_c0_seq3:1147-1464(-)